MMLRGSLAMLQGWVAAFSNSMVLRESAWSRFLKGGRGWKNPVKAEKPNTQAPNELRSPDQVRPCARELRHVLWHAQRDEHSGYVGRDLNKLRGRAGAEGAQAKS